MPYYKAALEPDMITATAMCGSGGAGGSDTAPVKKGDDMLSILSVAKDKDKKYIDEMYTKDKMDLYRRDPVVTAVEAKRRDEAGEKAADQLPLDFVQMHNLVTDETLRKVCEIDEHKHDIIMEIEDRYKDLEAILELPGIDVLDVLVKARILSDNHANILPACMRFGW